MIINDDILRREMIQLLKQVNCQIEEVNRHADQAGIQGYQLRDANGNWVMAPLLLAKTQVLAAIIQLQTKK